MIFAFDKKKYYLFVDDIILSVENSKNTSKKLLEPINQFSNLVKSLTQYRNILRLWKKKRVTKLPVD